MSRCLDIDEQIFQKSDEQMSDEQVLHNRLEAHHHKLEVQKSWTNMKSRQQI